MSANDCPAIPYGIPSAGATDLNFNSGRELFRCGDNCVKMFITNVTLERNTKFIHCGSISDAHVQEAGRHACMQSAQLNWRGQSVVNWEAKENVTSDLANGTVITVATDCAGSGASVYTHTEGQISGKCQANIDELTCLYDLVAQSVLDKCDSIDPSTDRDNLEWIFSDINNQSSATDWQSGSITYLGFGVDATHVDRTYNFSFNWQNGKSEVSKGVLEYDAETTPSLMSDVVSTMLGTSC